MSAAVAPHLFTIGAGLLAAWLLARQCRRPSGWFGKAIARSMNLSHAPLTTWGLSHISIAPTARILDIGCGGGATLVTLAALAPQGRVVGVDYAPASVATAEASIADLIRDGRVSVRQASVAQLPFDAASFDVVTAVETHYYWPHLMHCLREVHRVVAPGGQFMILAETYKGRSLDFIFRPVMFVLFRATYLSPEEHRDVMTQAGFSDVTVDTLRGRGWIAVVGTKRA